MMKRMRILEVAYPLFPVSSESAGGAEQILWLLDRGLVQRGHESIAVAARGSQVNGRLVETAAATGEITENARREAQQVHLDCIERAAAEYCVDAIHLHGLDFYTYLPAGPRAKLATLHLPVAWYPERIFELTDVQLCCVSQSQAATVGDGVQLPVVENGIDLSQYAMSGARGNYLLWLGRVCPEKGTDIALRVARRLNLPLLAAGPVHPFADHETYFEERVKPLLDEMRRYVGAAGLEQKKKLLAEARCVLIPSLAAETGSLVAMEALASGTPVIAYRSGALPEIVEHGATGFIVDSEEEMAEAVRRIGEISPERCQRAARARFDARRMVNDYIKLYEQLRG